MGRWATSKRAKAAAPGHFERVPVRQQAREQGDERQRREVDDVGDEQHAEEGVLAVDEANKRE